jgi:hypothetical protein
VSVRGEKTADPSAALGMDDKGKTDTSIKSGCWTEDAFHHLGWVAGPWALRSKNVSKIREVR